MQKLQTPEVFLEDLISSIKTAKNEVLVESMLFESGLVMDKLVDALLQAAEKGINIKINYDWVSQKYIHGDLPLVPIPFTVKAKYAKNLHRRNIESLKKLIETPNILTKEINKPNIIFSFLPFAGRNHMKIYIVDESVWIGGINLSDDSFNKIDFMVRFDNKSLTEEVKKIFLDNFENKKYHDFEKKVGEFEVIVDQGKKRKSLIYGRAVKIISQANESIVFMSQYVPDGKILKSILEKAKEGVSINVLTSPTESQVFSRYPEKFTYSNFLKKISKFPNIKLTHLDKNVHAKLILVDDKSAIFGSHNFVMPGVILGTKEIAIATEETSLIKEISLFSSKYLAFDNE